MEEAGVRRKLAAILAADVVGYSRLMAADERGTLEALRRHRAELIDPAIAALHGRIVKTTGDGLLAEFPSVVDAVRCAAEVQRAMAQRNADLPEDKRIVFRVGINLGDVVVEAGDIFGDGVNVAARLEEICPPGEVLISGTAFDHLEGKTDLGFEFLGEQAVKNIPSPVRTYRVLLAPGRAGEVIGHAKRAPGARAWAVAAALLLVVAGGGAWWWLSRPDFTPADPAKMAFKLPDKPSIAVLPFDNLSGDPEQDYFADGMAEDIITDLSRLSGLFVIARNSSFSYRGKQTDVRTIARELGVRYVLEGSVRRVGDQVRINAQLVDAESGGHLWAERYDGALADVFALQDKVTNKIVAALAVSLTAEEKAQRERKETEVPEAYDAFLQGRDYLRRRTPRDLGKAVEFLERAIELDPDYAHAYAALADAYWTAADNWWSYALPSVREGQEGVAAGREGAMTRAKTYLAKAMVDPTPLAHRVAADMLVHDWQHPKAITEAERALELEPSDADTLVTLASVLALSGRAAEAVPLVERAMRLDPHYPVHFLYVLGLAHFGQGDWDRAIEFMERGLKQSPENLEPLVPLVAAYAQAGRADDARSALARYLEYRGWQDFGGYGVRYYMLRWPFRDSETGARFGKGLATAGVCCEGEVQEFIDRMRKEGKVD